MQNYSSWFTGMVKYNMTGPKIGLIGFLANIMAWRNSLQMTFWMPFEQYLKNIVEYINLTIFYMFISSKDIIYIYVILTKFCWTSLNSVHIIWWIIRSGSPRARNHQSSWGNFLMKFLVAFPHSSWRNHVEESHNLLTISEFFFEMSQFFYPLVN